MKKERGLNFVGLASVFTLLLCWSGLCPDLLGQEQEKAQKSFAGQSYTVSAATSKIKVDGDLDEQAWQEATVLKLIYEWLPGDNVPPPVNTDFLITFSQDFLYMAFRCFDPDPKQIRAHLMDRDDTDRLIQDDHVSILLDTFNDERRGFQFRVNPLGVQADANFSEMEGYEDFSWDAIWHSAGKIHDWGYAIEIAIPFNQLRFPQSPAAQTWGVSPERSYPRNVRHRITSHRRDRNVACLLCQFDKVTGFQGMKPGYNLELDPTLTASRTDLREDFPSGKMEPGRVEANPGLTARWGITPNLILNAAANPDFSQVEADVAQLEVNTRFVLRYPEKRPFFLEGADFFLTPFEAVFTRTVADPVGGFKLTGKMGKNAFGFFGAYDRVNNLLFPSNQGSDLASLDEGVLSGVFRYRRDVGQGSTIGLLYTGRAGDGYFNHVAGADGFLRLSQTKTLRFQYLHSETDYAEPIALAFAQKTGRFGGNAFLASFNHGGRNWYYSLEYTDLSPGFRADSGYIPRVDTREASATVQRLFWGKKGDWFTQLGIILLGTATYNYSGDLTDSTLALGAAYAGPLQTRAQIIYFRERERYLTKDYDKNQVSVYSEIKPAGGMRFGLTGWFGDVVDYVNARKAFALSAAPSAEFSLGRHLNINLMHTFQRFSLKEEEIFQANLSQLKIIYNFGVRMFVRAIVQYLHLAQNPGLYVVPVDAKTQTFFTQFLFSYKINPQTVLFLGYSDNYLGLTGIRTTQTDRTFFIKVGYAWTR